MDKIIINKETPLISVILPVYNCEKYIRDSIQSILDQVFNDFELIIINDGSTDNTFGIIKSFSDDRIILVNQVNHGLTFSLNVGLSLAKGKYIARMDADDISLPDRFKKQVNFLSENL